MQWNRPTALQIAQGGTAVFEQIDEILQNPKFRAKSLDFGALKCYHDKGRKRSMAHSEKLTPLGGFSETGSRRLTAMAQDSGELTKFLRFQGRVFKHSPSVALEFYIQRPDTLFIGTAAQWARADSPVRQGGESIDFFDHDGNVISMYDFSQCESDAPPWQWTITGRNIAAVKAGMGVPQGGSLLETLVNGAVPPELGIETMQRLGLSHDENQARAFIKSMGACAGEIIAGRLAIGGGNYNLTPDHTAFGMLATNEQRMIFLALTARAARNALMKVEIFINERVTEQRIQEQEVKQDDLRRMDQTAGSRQADAAGERVPGDSEGSAPELSDESRREEGEGRDRLGDDTGVRDQAADGVVSGVSAEGSERRDDLVRLRPDGGDIQAERGTGAVDGGGADRELRSGVDALHGGQLPGVGGSPEIPAPVSDGSAEGGRERVGVSVPAGRAVREDESASEHGIRGESGVGTDTAVLHGQRGDAGESPDPADSSDRSDSITDTDDAEASEEPLTETDSGFSMPDGERQLSLFADEPAMQPDPVADEKMRLLRDDLRRGTGFQNGKLRVADYFAKNQPNDSDFAEFLKKEYGIGGHSGPDMPDVGYDGKGIHIISADKKGHYQYTWMQAAKEIRGMIERGEYVTAADIDDAVDNALYYLEDVEHLDDHERVRYTEQLKALRGHPLLTDESAARIDAYKPQDTALQLSAPARYIMDEDNMPMFVDRLVARDEMDDIAHRILDNSEYAGSVAADFIDESRYIISDHETFEAAEFAIRKDADGIEITAEPDSEHPFSVSYSWLQIGEFMRQAAQLHRDVEREAEEAWERDAAENMEAYDALDHHRDVYLSLPDENNARYPISDARRQELYNYRLHFEPDKGYLLLADSDTEDDLILRDFTMVNSQIVLHGLQEMGFTVTGTEPAFTYEIYQMKSGEEHHYHRFESMESNRYAHLTQEDYDLVYSGDLRDIEGDTVQQKLNALFEKFNTDHPADFFGHSMSTSDVIVVTEGSGRTPYYVQPVGFEVMPEFLAHRFDLIDIQFTGNPEGFNAIKVAARTDSFEDTGETNTLIPDTPVFYARLSENAVLADVQKVIQTAQENGCYLNGASVAYLTERFGADFMPEQDADLSFTLPESGITIDLAASESVTLTDSYSQYEGGIDSDGHERRDNYSSQSQSVTYSYRGHGIVEAVSYSPNRDFPIEEEYNIYNPAQRERLAADMRRFAERAESLTMHSEPRAVQQERNFVLILNDNEHQIQFGEAFDTLEAAQDAGNEAIWGGRAVGYAVLNRQEQKVEVYDSDFPTSGVFSEEVYRNSPFQTLTVHTDAPLKPEAEPQQVPARRGRSRSEQLYRMFCEMYPDIASGKHEYERYEDPNGEDSGFEPLAVEFHGGDQYSWTTFYIQEGDLMHDPDFCFLLDHENQRLEILSFQLDGVPPYGTLYQSCVDDNGNFDRHLQHELEEAMLQNLRNARDVGRKLVRYYDAEGNEVDIPPEEDAAPVTKPVMPAADDKSPELRAVLNQFAEEHGLGNLSIEQDRFRCFVNETFADGMELQLTVIYPDNGSPEAIQRELENWARESEYRGEPIAERGRRKAYAEIHGKAELLPVPDLPEIAYAANPRQKVRDNLLALRELKRLRDCEEAGIPLYDKRRSSETSREYSDMVLRRYSGWGSMGDVFDESKTTYEYERRELKRLLTEEQYAAIRATVTDAHYTPQIVIERQNGYKSVFK